MKNDRHVKVLGTGGTIAGTATSTQGDANYSAAQLSVEQLLLDLPALRGIPLETQQVAQVDSKDMAGAVWLELLSACQSALTDERVVGVVITHGTDTLEETAVWLHLLLSDALRSSKPVVLTCAMRPSTSAEADGPRNLVDAVSLAWQGGEAGLTGVMLAAAGEVHHAMAVRKVHSHRLNAFSSGDWPLLADVRVDPEHPMGRSFVRNPDSAIELASLSAIKEVAISGQEAVVRAHVEKSGLPWVEIIHSHADANGRILDRLFSHPAEAPQGLVIAGTGNGTVHEQLLRKLEALQAEHRIPIWRSTRCVLGSVTARDDDTLMVTPLPPAKARVAMQVMLIAARLRSPLPAH